MSSRPAAPPRTAAEEGRNDRGADPLPAGRAARSMSPGIAAWWEARWCGGWRASDARSLIATHAELDLQASARRPRTGSWRRKPDAVFVAAATVGGILANDTRPAEFLYDNLMIAANVIDGARRAGVRKLLFLGSSCIYPRLAPAADDRGCAADRRRSSRRTSGTRSPRSPASSCAEAYRRQWGCDFISAQPTNLYGPGDTYDARASHVIPALHAEDAPAPNAPVRPRSRSGAPARRGASSSMSTISPTRWCS